MRVPWSHPIVCVVRKLGRSLFLASLVRGWELHLHLYFNDGYFPNPGWELTWYTAKTKVNKQNIPQKCPLHFQLLSSRLQNFSVDTLKTFCETSHCLHTLLSVIFLQYLYLIKKITTFWKFPRNSSVLIANILFFFF